jgi:hypothetical protein
VEAGRFQSALQDTVLLEDGGKTASIARPGHPKFLANARHSMNGTNKKGKSAGNFYRQ